MASISSIAIRNLMLFKDDQTIDFRQPATLRVISGVFLFVGANNTGKTTVLEACDFAATALRCFQPDTYLDPTKSKLEQMEYCLQIKSTIGAPSKTNVDQPSLFVVQVLRENTCFLFGIYASQFVDKWEWNKNREGNEMGSVVFLFSKSNLYLVYSRNNRRYIRKKRSISEEIRAKITGRADEDHRLEELQKLIESAWGEEEERYPDKEYHDTVDNSLPWSMVDREKLIEEGQYGHGSDMYFVGDDKVRGDGNLVFPPRKIPSGLKFKNFITNVIKHIGYSAAESNRCLLLEEPTRSMHPALIRRFTSEMTSECKKHNLQIIMTTHSQEAVSCVPLRNVFFFRRAENTRRILVSSVLPSTAGMLEGDVGPIRDQSMVREHSALSECLFSNSCVLVPDYIDKCLLETLVQGWLDEEEENFEASVSPTRAVINKLTDVAIVIVDNLRRDRNGPDHRSRESRLVGFLHRLEIKCIEMACYDQLWQSGNPPREEAVNFSFNEILQRSDAVAELKARLLDK